jgi:hypothetical protein
MMAMDEKNMDIVFENQMLWFKADETSAAGGSTSHVIAFAEETLFLCLPSLPVNKTTSQRPVDFCTPLTLVPPLLT